MELWDYEWHKKMDAWAIKRLMAHRHVEDARFELGQRVSTWMFWENAMWNITNNILGWHYESEVYNKNRAYERQHPNRRRKK
jgi:hypothetical protein